MKKPVNMRIEESLWEATGVYAKSNRRTTTSVVEEALEHFIGWVHPGEGLPEAGASDPEEIAYDEPPPKKAKVWRARLIDKAADPEECPYTAIQLRGKSSGALTLSAAERAIKDGTWRKWL